MLNKSHILNYLHVAHLTVHVTYNPHKAMYNLKCVFGSGMLRTTGTNLEEHSDSHKSYSEITGK